MYPGILCPRVIIVGIENADGREWSLLPRHQRGLLGGTTPTQPPRAAIADWEPFRTRLNSTKEAMRRSDSRDYSRVQSTEPKAVDREKKEDEKSPLGCMGAGCHSGMPV